MGIYGTPHDTKSISQLPMDSGDSNTKQKIRTLIDTVNGLTEPKPYLLMYDETGLPRMLMGYVKDGWGAGHDFGILVSVAGTDVRVATGGTVLYSLATP